MKRDLILQMKLNWLQRQEEIPMTPLKGDGIVTIQGRDILDLEYRENGALVVITEIEEFYLIPAS
ncbi:hypothetical protein D3C75_178910 [compost metagenome]